MRKDPLQFSHGELGTLKNFLGSEYHQDVWEEFATHAGVWDEYIHLDSIDGIELLIEQIDIVLRSSPKEIHEFIKKEESGGLYLKTPQDSVAWLKKCRDYMQQGLEKKKREGRHDSK
jgi:hypothetical protein